MANLDFEYLDLGHSGPIDPIRLVDRYPDVVGTQHQSVAVGQVHSEVSVPASLDLTRSAGDEL